MKESIDELPYDCSCIHNYDGYSFAVLIRVHHTKEKHVGSCKHIEISGKLQIQYGLIHFLIMITMMIRYKGVYMFNTLPTNTRTVNNINEF